MPVTETQPHHPETRESRLALGKKRRDVASRLVQKNVAPKERKFDPIEILLSSAEGRLTDLLPTKYARMSVSPFAFFRGAVSIMAADLARLPHSGIDVQLCGDAHVQNLGSFAAPDGRLVFDFNDFDETIRGPWEWDVKRMAASIVLAGREAGHKSSGCDCATEAFLECYCRFTGEFSSQPILQVARHQIHREQRIAVVSAALKQSQRATPADTFKRFIASNGHGEPKFRDGKPLFWRVGGNDAKQVLSSLEAYRQSLRSESVHLFDLFEPRDVGFKVVGTGSVGLRDYIVLFEGNGLTDPLFLQFKQEMPSAYARYLPEASYQHEGQRAAEGQRAIQPLSRLTARMVFVRRSRFSCTPAERPQRQYRTGQTAGRWYGESCASRGRTDGPGTRAFGRCLHDRRLLWFRHEVDQSNSRIRFGIRGPDGSRLWDV